MPCGDPPPLPWNDAIGYLPWGMSPNFFTGPGDWRHDLSYELQWEPLWSAWRIPTPLWFWRE